MRATLIVNTSKEALEQTRQHQAALFACKKGLLDALLGEVDLKLW
jgi:hypothetical protein